MTALDRYARLEAEGRYFDGERAEPRPVVVSFGKRSLVMMGYDGVAIAHWPLGSLRSVGSAGQRPLQLVPDPESDERLVLEDADMSAAIREVCPDLDRRPARPRSVGRALILGLAALGAVVLLVTAILPALAGQLARLVPPEREVQLGEAIEGQVRRLLAGFGDPVPYCTAPEGKRALEAMVARLDAGAGIPYPLEVGVLDHRLVNAAALPGGRILLFGGLLETAESPEEVAGVLAHEIGHVVLRHPTAGTLRAAGTAGILGLLVGDVTGAAAVVAASEAMLSASYRREAEREADAIALEILADAGLPSTPFAGFFLRMRERMREEGYEGGGILEYLASHPALEARAERAETGDTVAGAFRPILDDAGWDALRNICSEVAEPEKETAAGG